MDGAATTVVEAVAKKRCPKCGDFKPLTEFHVCGRSANGRYCYCKTCQVSLVMTWKRTPLGKIAQMRTQVRAQLRTAWARVARYEARLAELDAEYGRLKDEAGTGAVVQGPGEPSRRTGNIGRRIGPGNQALLEVQDVKAAGRIRA